MYLKVLRYTMGYVKFKGTGVFFERFLNMLSNNHLSIWDVNVNDTNITASCTLADYKKIEVIAQKLEIKINKHEKFGLPLKVKTLKARLGLFLGLVFFVASIIVYNNFIWEIEVVNYDEQKSEFLLEELKIFGVHVGAYIPDLDLRSVKEEVLIRSEDLSWIALNREGTKITVEVAEKDESPQVESTEICDVVATKTGIIMQMEVYEGTALVTMHDVVVEGDILVSREVRTPTAEQKADGSFVEMVSEVSADAKIIAQTSTVHTISFALNQSEKEYISESATRRFLSVFGVNIPLFIAFDFEHEFDEKIEYTPIAIGENILPIGVYEKKYEFYETVEKTYTKQEAIGIIAHGFKAFEEENMADVSIISYTDIVTESENTIFVKREYVSHENIAKKTTEIE